MGKRLRRALVDVSWVPEALALARTGLPTCLGASANFGFYEDAADVLLGCTGGGDQPIRKTTRTRCALLSTCQGMHIHLLLGPHGQANCFCLDEEPRCCLTLFPMQIKQTDKKRVGVHAYLTDADCLRCLISPWPNFLPFDFNALLWVILSFPFFFLPPSLSFPSLSFPRPFSAVSRLGLYRISTDASDGAAGGGDSTADAGDGSGPTTTTGGGGGGESPTTSDGDGATDGGNEGGGGSTEAGGEETSAPDTGGTTSPTSEYVPPTTTTSATTPTSTEQQDTTSAFEPTTSEPESSPTSSPEDNSPTTSPTSG